MSVNPYPQLPHSKGNDVMQNVVQTASVKGILHLEQGTISSVLNLTPDTTLIEISAVGGAAAMRWVSVADGNGTATSVITAIGTINIDHTIPTGTVRQFAVPIETTYQAPSSMVGANILNGLYRKVAVRAITAGSVILTQY